MRRAFILTLVIACAAFAHTQGGNTLIIRFAGAPSGTCAPFMLGINNATGGQYDCTVGGAWNLIGGGGGGTGTVTSVTFTGDGVVDSATPSTAVTTSGTVTATIINQTANTFLSGPSSAGPSAPTFRTIAAADIPSGTVTWDKIGSPGGNQTLTMTGDSTTWNWGATNTNKFAFDTSGSPTFGLVSATTAVTNSPTVTIQGSYQNAGTPTFAANNWTITNEVGSGTNGTSDLLVSQSGTTGVRQLRVTSFQSTSPSIAIGTSNTGIGQDGSNNFLMYSGGNMNAALTGSTGLAITNAGLYSWVVSGSANGTKDTGISRDAAGVVDVGAGTAGDTTGKLKAAGYMSVGTTFTTDTGCGTVTSKTGGATAGSFIAQATGACTVVITMGNSSTAPNGWACAVSDRTTANLFRQTASSATTATVSGTAVTSDVISFGCMGY